jgi:hypothetical protein
MKKILFTSLLFVSACILMAQQNGNDDFVIEIQQVNQQQVAVITGYNGSSTQITIPDQINGYPVAGIGNNAFRSRRLESVRFPASLQFIGEYAFYDNRLGNIAVPPSVTSVGAGAFDNNVSGNTLRSDSATYVRSFTIEPAHSDTVYTKQAPNAAPQSVNIIVVPGYSPVRPSQQQQPTGIVTVQENRLAPPANVRTAPLPVNTGNSSAYRPSAPAQSYAPQSYTTQSYPTQSYPPQSSAAQNYAPQSYAPQPAAAPVTTVPATVPNEAPPAAAVNTVPSASTENITAVAPQPIQPQTPPPQQIPPQPIQPQQVYSQQPQNYVQYQPSSSDKNSVRLVPEHTVDISVSANPPPAVVTPTTVEEKDPVRLYQREVYPLGRTPAPR